MAKSETKTEMKQHLKRDKKKNLKSNIYFLGLASLLNDMATEMITPILPIFLTSVLGASGFAVGLIEGSAKAAEQLLSIFSGWYSDKIRKRKPLVIAGYLLANLMKGAFAFTTSWPQFLFVRFAERSGKAIRTPARDAILAQSVEVKERRAGFALHRIMDTGGALIGPLIAIGLLAQFNNDINTAARSIFVLALIPGLIAVAVLVFFVREPPATKERTEDKKRRFNFGQIFNLSAYGTGFRTLVISFVILSLLAPALAFFYLKASGLGFDLSGVLLLAFLFSITYIFGAGALSLISKIKKISEKQGIVIGLIGLAVVFLFTAKVTDIESFTILLAIYGFFVGLLEVETKAYVASLIEKDRLASAYGTYQTSVGFATLGGGIVFGLLWDFSSVYAFQVAAIGAFIAAGLFIGSSKKLEKKNK